MSKPVDKAVDHIQQRLADYAFDLHYDGLSPAAVHAAKVRVIDTLGALIGGFFGETCRIARNLAAQLPDCNGATVIGTRMMTTPDMAALVNGTTVRYIEMTDVYHWPGSFGGHPSDVVTTVLAAAEHAQAGGRDFITGIVLAYEIFLRLSDVFHNDGFDHTNLGCLGTALAAGKLLGLNRDQLAHCLSMAAVSNNALRQVRLGDSSMWKAMATGHAGRAGMFAALLARAGMEGPHLPFEGKAGWCAHVAREPITLGTMGGGGIPFKILDTRTKHRSASGATIPSILAAEKVAAVARNIEDVMQVTVEVSRHAKDHGATGERHWNPQTRETADHSIPYVVAVTLMEGSVTPRSFNDAHLSNPKLRALVHKIEVVENAEFTKAYDTVPQQHLTRVIVVNRSGERQVGESGGDHDDLATQKSDAQIIDKFRMLTEDVLGAKRVNAILERLWNLEDMSNAAAIPRALALD